MTANEIIGKLIAEPKYMFADHKLIAEVVRDIQEINDPTLVCEICKYRFRAVEDTPCDTCYPTDNRPKFERA